MEPGRDNSVAPTKINLPSKSPRALCWSTRPVQTNKNQSSFKLKVTIVVILRFNSNWFVIFVITSIIITINDLIHVCCQTYIANATNINLHNSRNSTKQQIWNPTKLMQFRQLNATSVAAQCNLMPPPACRLFRHLCTLATATLTNISSSAKVYKHGTTVVVHCTM